jgi:ligand-binding SRPBCC domain-containing protein
MRIYQIKRTQILPLTLEEAWNFFSSPENLGRITPSHIRFHILGISGGTKMHSGQIIRYRIFILPLIPVRWTTEITHVQEPYFFVDVQRSGPFAIWEHQHRFRQVTDGVEMIDEVSYAIPLGLIGRFVHRIFVKREVNRIFDYRFQILEKTFNRPGTNTKQSV